MTSELRQNFQASQAVHWADDITTPHQVNCLSICGPKLILLFTRESRSGQIYSIDFVVVTQPLGCLPAYLKNWEAVGANLAGCLAFSFSFFPSSLSLVKRSVFNRVPSLLGTEKALFYRITDSKLSKMFLVHTGQLHEVAGCTRF